jgi:P4 family phage/plasmid primase-like protien
LRGLRYVIAAELEEGTRLDTSTVKKLSSTDDIHAEKKFEAPFDFEPSHTVVLYTNHLPKVGTIDEGTWRRIIPIPFNAVIEGDADIKNYADHLFEHAGAAILHWVIAGAKKLIAQGFKIEKPEIVKAALADYRGASDWLAEYVGECCEVGENYSTGSGKLYEDYRAYCGRMGEYARGTGDFYAALSGEGFARRKTKTGAFIYGLRLSHAWGAAS